MENNMDVRNALEEVTEVTTGSKTGLKQGLVSGGIAVGSVVIWEGGKWLYKKLKKAWSKRKAKKTSESDTIELDDEDVKDVDEEYPIK